MPTNPDVPARPQDLARAAAIRANVERVRERVSQAAVDAGRDPSSVRLLVATKTQSPADVLAAVAAGVDLVGENQVQELVAKTPALAPLVAAGTLGVHLIGHLQSNKVNAVVGRATCVESVDSFALARRLDARVRSVGAAALDVLVQVNVSGEATKSGVAPDAAVDLALAVAELPALRLAGFMTIGARSAADSVVREGYARLRDVRDDVVGGARGTSSATTLSMGMSGDLELAVAEGATLVRVGTAVFGPRDAPPRA